MSLTTAGFLITIAAIILAVPLSMVANLLTPAFRDWLVGVSRKQLCKRLAKLELQLAAAEKTWTFSPGEWELFRGNSWFTRLILGGFYLLFTNITLVAYFKYSALATLLPGPLIREVTYAFGVADAVTVWCLFRVRKHQRLYRIHRPNAKKSLLEEIQKLKSLEAPNS